MNEIIIFCKIFILILSILNITKNIYGFLKVIRTQEGHFENGKYGNLLLGLSISYIITTLIMSF